MKKLIILAVIPLAFLLFTQTHHKTYVANDYPAVWKDLPKDSLSDSWSMGSRECTSWVAWKIFKTFNYGVTGWGNAQRWDDNAHTRGITVNQTPEIHAVLVDDSFYPGHVAWVEHINKDGTIHISQYNADSQGNYSEEDVSPNSFQFIHFKQKS